MRPQGPGSPQTAPRGTLRRRTRAVQRLRDPTSPLPGIRIAPPPMAGAISPLRLGLMARDRRPRNRPASRADDSRRTRSRRSGDRHPRSGRAPEGLGCLPSVEFDELLSRALRRRVITPAVALCDRLSSVLTPRACELHGLALRSSQILLRVRRRHWAKPATRWPPLARPHRYRFEAEPVPDPSRLGYLRRTSRRVPSVITSTRSATSASTG